MKTLKCLHLKTQKWFLEIMFWVHGMIEHTHFSVHTTCHGHPNGFAIVTVKKLIFPGVTPQY